MLRALLFASVLLAPLQAFAWGHRGHEYTGAIADHLLSKNAAAAVEKNVGFPLRIAARWADCARDVKRRKTGEFYYRPDPKYSGPCEPFKTSDGIARMVDFGSRNWDACEAKKDCHSHYHFANIPTQLGKYGSGYAGAF